MKKFVIILLILIGWIYYSTGRYMDVKKNISRKGITALIEEPYWLTSWLEEKWQGATQGIHNSIDRAGGNRQSRVDRVSQ